MVTSHNGIPPFPKSRISAPRRHEIDTTTQDQPLKCCTATVVNHITSSAGRLPSWSLTPRMPLDNTANTGWLISSLKCQRHGGWFASESISSAGNTPRIYRRNASRARLHVRYLEHMLMTMMAYFSKYQRRAARHRHTSLQHRRLLAATR